MAIKEHALESDFATMHPLISWRSVVAGLLVAFFTMAGLLGLGMAFGGIGMDAETSVMSAGVFTGVWFIVSALISIFIGSYFAARVSKFQTGRIGSAQGIVIASLFLGFFLYQIVAVIGNAGQLAGSMIGSSASLIGQGAQQAAQNQTIVNTVSTYAEDALGNLNLKSDIRTVASGVVTRLVNGNVEGARTYLSRQSGITPEEAQGTINQIQNRVDSVITQAKNVTGTALKSAGWTIFLLIALGALSAMGGGALGSAANFKKPLSREQYESHLRHQHV